MIKMLSTKTLTKQDEQQQSSETANETTKESPILIREEEDDCSRTVEIAGWLQICLQLPQSTQPDNRGETKRRNGGRLFGIGY